jgi:hypothetical protein
MNKTVHQLATLRSKRRVKCNLPRQKIMQSCVQKAYRKDSQLIIVLYIGSQCVALFPFGCLETWPYLVFYLLVIAVFFCTFVVPTQKHRSCASLQWQRSDLWVDLGISDGCNITFGIVQILEVLRLVICWVSEPLNVCFKFYICCPHCCVISKCSSCIPSNTTRQILIRTHYIGDMFRLTL